MMSTKRKPEFWEETEGPKRKRPTQIIEDNQLDLTFFQKPNRIRADITANYHRGNLQSMRAARQTNSAADQKKILDYLGTLTNGATCDEIEVALSLSHQTASARCSSLKASGLVEVIGERKTRTGRSADVLAVRK